MTLLRRDNWLLARNLVSDLFDDAAIARVERQIDEWLGRIRASYTNIEAVDRAEGDEIRWFIRMRGEEKDFTTIWLTLGQRTLRYETYVMPAPEQNAELLYETILRRNEKLVGAHFSIGVEDAIFLRGELVLSALVERELDRAIGTMYAVVEQLFWSLLEIGFAKAKAMRTQRSSTRIAERSGKPLGGSSAYN
ncbi:hypothetical protein EMGBS4_07340 [Acidimicrobiaceae bacterium]|nr:hypothetical protein EMGBS4_07340 [Acidimicrobiaceae bacterium]